MLPGLTIVGAAAAASLLFALAARRPSLASTLLIAYLAYVANVGILTLALSPLREVTRGGLAVAEAVVLAAAFACWWVRGRPRPPLAATSAATRAVVSDPVTALFLCVVLGLLAYELVLALTVPPNNGDSLGYHLTRAAAWAQHGGIYWIPDAPWVKLNAFQPLAEQQILFLFATTKTGALFALPQYVAELAILVAIYGAARRLGFAVRAAACSAFLFATFSLPALEATTAQNDLVAASFPVVAACLLLGEGWLEPAFAGAAAAFGVGTKLTTGFVVPVLALLALPRGRRVVTFAAAGGVLGSVALGMWGYVLNAVHTGHVLGVGTGALEDRGSPSYPGSVANAFYLMYGLMDLSVLSNRLIHVLALAGAVAAVGVATWTLRRAGVRRALGDAAAVATPFLAPLLVVGGALALAAVARLWGFPIRGPGGLLGPVNLNLGYEYTRISNEDYSAFGPVGIVALLAASAVAVWAFVARRTDARQLAFASALPVFLVLLALESTWLPFHVRFFLVPAALASPLLAHLFRDSVTTGAYLVVAALTIALTITEDQTKPLQSRAGLGRPWSLTRPEALYTNSMTSVSASIAVYDKVVPAHACVGAVLDGWEPSFLLYGSSLDHRVFFLPAGDAVAASYRRGLFYVVISGTRSDAPQVASQFKAAGWRVRTLGGFWQLASAPRARSGACTV